MKNAYFSSNFIATLESLSLKVRTTLSSNNIYNINKKIKIIYYIGCDDLRVRINLNNPKGITAGNTVWVHGLSNPLCLINPFGYVVGGDFTSSKDFCLPTTQTHRPSAQLLFAWAGGLG
jgi:hypothetical protein